MNDYRIARAKLYLAQEKFTELQKRYFSVCRELALMAGGNAKEEVEPANFRAIAEKMVERRMWNIRKSLSKSDP